MQPRLVCLVFFALFFLFAFVFFQRSKPEPNFNGGYSSYYAYGYGDSIDVFHSGHDKGNDNPVDSEENNPMPKATFVMLVKDSIAKAVKAIENIDTAFNWAHGYPITLFYEELSVEEMDAVQRVSTGEITFVKLNMQLPSWLNISEIPPKTGYQKDYIGYRHMCRWYSGLIFREQVLQQYDFMWRLDDDAEYLCDIKRDPFRYMRDNGYKYGWVQWFWEDVPISGQTLWPVTRAYAELKGMDTRLEEVETLLGEYDRCHYWNNFEILDMRFFRSKQYMDYFDYLDKSSGFYFYRWGDALVRTLGIYLLLDEEDVTRISWISYAHGKYCVRKECSQDYPCEHCSDGLCDFCTSVWQRKTHGFRWDFIGLVVSIWACVVLYCLRERISQKGQQVLSSIKYFKNAARKN